MMHQLHRSIIGFLPALLLLAALLGCGSRRGAVPVGGVVTLDGKPVDNAAVMLMPSGPEAAGLPAVGTTDPQGRFTLSTANIGPGAMPGEYRVTVIKKETTGFLADEAGLDDGIAPEGIRETWIIPRRYADPNTSGITVEVHPGMEPLSFDLQS